MMENKPVAAYTLSMIGAALQAVAALFVIYMVAFFSTVASNWREISPERMMPWMMGHWLAGYPYTIHPVWSIVWLIFTVVIVVLGFYGALMMNSSDLARVRMGSTLALIASIIAFPTMWGFLIGSLLMFVGSLLGLTWAPPRSQAS